MKRHGMVLPALLCLATATGCDKVSPAAGWVAAQPSNDPVRPVTQFSSALPCLDNLFRTQPNPMRGNQNPEYLTVGLIPDSTDRIRPGLRDMVSGAAFDATKGNSRYILLDAVASAGLGGLPSSIQLGAIGGILVGASGGGPAERLSNAGAVEDSIQIVGSLTQADKGIQQVGTNAGVTEKDNAVGVGATSDFGAVALDLRLVHVKSKVTVGSTSSGLIIVNRGTSANASFKIGSVGLTFDHTVDRREGPHQAVRTLVQLSIIELLGTHARVPYWQCLTADRQHPKVQEQARLWYERMSQDDLDRYVRERLKVLGFDPAPPPGSYVNALSSFQRRQELIPTGRPSFETFLALSGGSLPEVGASLRPPASLPPATPMTPRSLTIAVRESVQDRSLWLNIGLDRTGYLTCYYRDERDRIVQLYPNRYQPQSLSAADLPVTIPPEGQQVQFLLKPDVPSDRVGFLCVSTANDVTASLPQSLRASGFQQVGMSGFPDIVAAYRAVGGRDIAIRSTTRGSPDGRWDEM